MTYVILAYVLLARTSHMPKPDTYWVGKHRLPRGSAARRTGLSTTIALERISQKSTAKGLKQKKNKHVPQREILFRVSV